MGKIVEYLIRKVESCKTFLEDKFLFSHRVEVKNVPKVVIVDKEKEIVIEKIKQMNGKTFRMERMDTRHDNLKAEKRESIVKNKKSAMIEKVAIGQYILWVEV